MGFRVLNVIALVAFTSLEIVSAADKPVFTMCVPEIYWKDCESMMEDSSTGGIPIACVTGRDRYECIEKVGRKEADVVAVDPEDMYLAAKNNLAASAGYNVVEQIRTKEEPDEPYRYEAVLVIRKDLEIHDIHDLRGLKSCHTGVGRNVGYKIPITKLSTMGVLSNINDPEYSARENEIRALSTFFTKSCLVGTWSPDPAINKKMKENYSNMCALCEHPEICDYPDKYSGYDGALRCLAHNGGDVAFTKVIYVKRFFGLPVGVKAAVPTNEDPSNYAYLCPDASKVEINAKTKPCTWAARPWQGYMTNGEVKNIENVQKELTDLGILGEQEKANWWKDLLLLNEKTLAVKSKPESPEQHLEESKYLDVIERNSGSVERVVRWCVWGEDAMKKCKALAAAAHSRDARPQIECVSSENQEGCLTSIRDDGADIVAVDGGDAKKAMADYNLKPIVAETYGPGSSKVNEQPAVAVIKKTSGINNLNDLKGKRSCHTYYKKDFAGWLAPAHILKEAKLISSDEEMSEFFGSSCAPGAATNSKLCQNCVGNLAADSDQTKGATKCLPTPQEAFSGGYGALKCLATDHGDVAFVPLTAIKKLANSTSENEIKLDEMQLLCPSGGVKSIESWQDCNFGLEPPRVILSSKDKSQNVLNEYTHCILTASTLYSKRPDLLQLFGSWGGQKNVLFKDDTIGLTSVDDSWNNWNDWQSTKQNYGSI